MDKKERIDNLIDWLEGVCRLIYKDKKWRPHLICDREIYADGNEYSASIKCENCGGSRTIYIKKGISLQEVLAEEIKCPYCRVEGLPRTIAGKK